MTKQRTIELRLSEDELEGILHWKDAHDAHCVKEAEYDATAELIKIARDRLEKINGGD